METLNICKQKNISIQPNPFDNYAIITIPEEVRQPYTLEIIDINGNKIFQYSNILSNKFILGRNKLKPGAYFYKLFTNDYKFFYTGKLNISKL
ncbi:MAG: T9SS type A sorting domain-containing protein [Bacteroidales bacterium]|nr:MAG: T9SS type A sorting domain-containing protein [Bacteroidales bacterium]